MNKEVIKSRCDQLENTIEEAFADLDSDYDNDTLGAAQFQYGQISVIRKWADTDPGDLAKTEMMAMLDSTEDFIVNNLGVEK